MKTTSKNTKASAKPKPTKRAPKQKAEKTLPQMLANLARSIRYDTEDVVATRINGLWDAICQRNRAAEEAQRKRIAELEYEIGQRNALVGQRGFELRAAQEEIGVLQRKLAHAEIETKEARKLHRVPQMVQLEIESLRMELDKERAATKAVRAHATYDGERLRQDMTKRNAEKDAALAAANEEIARLAGQVRVEREVYEEIMDERKARMRSAVAGSVETSAGVPPADGQFAVNVEGKEG